MRLVPFLELRLNASGRDSLLPLTPGRMAFGESMRGAGVRVQLAAVVDDESRVLLKTQDIRPLVDLVRSAADLPRELVRVRGRESFDQDLIFRRRPGFPGMHFAPQSERGRFRLHGVARAPEDPLQFTHRSLRPESS